jgi:hypothetical protein
VDSRLTPPPFAEHLTKTLKWSTMGWGWGVERIMQQLPVSKSTCRRSLYNVSEIYSCDSPVQVPITDYMHSEESEGEQGN